jgi:CHAT domain-containing protein
LLAISPDDSLTAVPWGALLPAGRRVRDAILREFGKMRLRTLYQQYSIAIVPSARLLLAAYPKAREDDKPSRAIVFGALAGVSIEQQLSALPLLSQAGQDLRPLPPLHYGLSEIAAVANALQRLPDAVFVFAEPVIGTSELQCRLVPSLSEALALLPSTDIVHVVAHAVFNAVLPMESVIFVGMGHSGKPIKAEELLAIDFRRSRLVVFWACGTAQSRYSAGGEPFGFLRGLMGGGARTAILTRWPVDDAATAKFFEIFYGALMRVGAGEALRVAAVQTARQRVHPFFWSGPALYGWWR